MEACSKARFKQLMPEASAFLNSIPPWGSPDTRHIAWYESENGAGLVVEASHDELKYYWMVLGKPKQFPIMSWAESEDGERRLSAEVGDCGEDEERAHRLVQERLSAYERTGLPHVDFHPGALVQVRQVLVEPPRTSPQ